MKIIDILKSASSNLLRNKGRTVLTIVAIFIGAFTISLTNGVNIGVNEYIDKQVNDVGGENVLMIYAKDENSTGMGTGNEPTEYNPDKGTGNEPSALSKKDLEKIKEIKNIETAKESKTASVNYIEGKTDKKYNFSISSSSDITIDLEAGKQVNNKTPEYEINIAPEYLKSLGYSSAKKAINQKVKLAIASTATGEEEILEATIVGVRNNSLIQGGQSIVNTALENKVIDINQQGLPDNMKERFYFVEATMNKGISKEEVKKIQTKLDKEGYASMTIEDQIGMIRNVINAITGVLTMFGAIALLAASFGIINTLYMSVQERTREIGLMKAMGLGSGKVFAIFSFEAALIGFLGSLLGILGAVGVGSVINQIAKDSFLKSLTGFTLIQFSIPSTISIIVLIMGIAFLAGTLPARRAAKLDPIEALRYE